MLFGADEIHNLIQRDVVKGPIDSDWSVETWSLYLMDTVDVNEWLTLNGGVRVDSFEYRNAVGTTNPTLYSYEDTLWNGHAGVTLRPHEEGIVYFSWGTAKNINGGESDLGGNCGYGGVCVPNDPSFQIGDGSPESTDSFELGTKWDLFDDRFLVTGALFQITKDGVFEAAGDGYEPGGSLNTGKNRVRGIEASVVGNLTDELMAQVAGTIMDSEVLQSNDPASVGLALANFAEEQYYAHLRYQATPAFAIGGTATYKGEMFTGQPDAAAGYDPVLEVYTYRVPDYWTFDAFASYRFGTGLEARLNVSNVFNEDFYLAGYRSGHFLYKGDERRATLTLTGRF